MRTAYETPRRCCVVWPQKIAELTDRHIMAHPGFGHLWQQAEMSDLDIVISVDYEYVPNGTESRHALFWRQYHQQLHENDPPLQQFPGHSTILSLSPFFKAQASVRRLKLLPCRVSANPIVSCAGVALVGLVDLGLSSNFICSELHDAHPQAQSQQSYFHAYMCRHCAGQHRPSHRAGHAAAKARQPASGRQSSWSLSPCQTPAMSQQRWQC